MTSRNLRQGLALAAVASVLALTSALAPPAYAVSGAPVQAAPIDTTTTVAASANPTQAGVPVVFTATVSTTVGLPVQEGTVTFAEGATAFGPDVAVANGKATITVSTLTAGSHTVTATFHPGATTKTSTGTVIQQVDKAPTTAAVLANPTPSVVGQPVTFTATLGGPGLTPTGSVTFTEGATTLGSGTLAGGVATITTSALALGPHSITASYSGDNNRLPTTTSASHTVNQAATTTVITSSADPAGMGASVTLTITVKPTAPATGTPTGSVSVSIAGDTPSVLPLTNGAATLTQTFTTIGAFAVSAGYAGDASFQASTGTFTQDIVAGIAAAALTSSETDGISSYAQTVTFTATITATGNATTEGTAELFDDATSLGTAAVTNAPVTFEVAGLVVGDHHLKIVFTPKAGTPPVSSNTLTHAVVQADTATTVADAAGFSITVTVSRVAPGTTPTTTATTATTATTVAAGASAAAVAGVPAAAPTGTVTVSKEGQQVGTGTLKADGTVEIAMQGLAAGTHALTVAYSGDANHKASSTTFEKTVTAEAAAGAGGAAAAGGGAVARTGTESLPLAGTGVALLAAGVAAVLLGTDLRRRRRRPVPSRYLDKR